MPGLNGMDFIKKIKNLNPLIRTILITPFAIKVDLFQAHARQERKNAFLQKTINLEKLCAVANNQLQTCELLKQKLPIKML
jgi:response regulator RpfG family c-di-GMP phosphodiesterase